MEDQTHLNNFNFYDFTYSNFDQIVGVVRGENESAEPINSFHESTFNEFKLHSGFIEDGGFCPTPEDMFHFNCGSPSDPNSFFDSLQQCTEDVEENQGDDSTATTTRSVDRARTLVSERRRRGRMKEKLYALRALVPNITKMDKASIVGDAVMYVQNLQTQAKKLKAEIAGLESSLKSGSQRSFADACPYTHIAESKRQSSICRKVVQMDVFKVEEKGFYVRMVCRKGEGVVVALYKALESLTCFQVQSSNISATPERIILTFTLHVRECGEEINISSMKLWVMGSLLTQGFEFEMSMT